MLRTSYLLSILFLFASTIAFTQVPAAPAGSTTWSRLEESSNWDTCGNCGNSGGTGRTATYSMERGLTSPNVDGSSTRFSIGGTHGYKNAYWFIKHYNAPAHPLTYLKYDFYVWVPIAYEHTPQAIEFECQQKVGGYLYNFAWQMDYRSHRWRTFNFTLKQWESSGVYFSGLSGGKWHHVVAEFHTYNKQVIHDAITLDGVRHKLSIKHPGRVWNSGRYLSNAFQLDLDSNATDYHVYVDAMKVTFK